MESSFLSVSDMGRYERNLRRTKIDFKKLTVNLKIEYRTVFVYQPDDTTTVLSASPQSLCTVMKLRVGVPQARW